MASTSSTGSTHSPQVVGNAFVQQYYYILHHSPEVVFRFYQENSCLSRPEPHGGISVVKTMEAINEKILSMNYSESRFEIKTVDAQDSWNKGVLVLVTGYLTGKDDVRRDFTQSFFLAPQDRGGYFVLNDIFRYVSEVEHVEGSPALANGGGEPVPLEQESFQLQDHPVTEPAIGPVKDEEEITEAEGYNPSENDASDVGEEAPVAEAIDEVPNTPPPVAEHSASFTQEVAPKKSYASIVKVMKEIAASLSGPTHAPIKPAAVVSERNIPPTASLAPPAVEAPISISNTTEGTGSQEAEVDGYSIFVKGLPVDATVEQLTEQFKRFGPIKPHGVQVRSQKQQGFCFGFVEFEVASAVQSAIEASPIAIGNRQAHVEEKRPSGSRANNKGRYSSGRGGGFRNEGARSLGNHSGGRGYGRGDYSSRTDFGNRSGSRGGGYSGRGGEVGYQRVDTGSNRGRGNRSGSTSR